MTTKTIKLINIKIRNFKGVSEFDFKADGENLEVFGENASGKTTLYDAFLYCLFGKDSTESTKFAWKPLDIEGKEINRLETEVITTLSVDGEQKTFSRMTKEKWTRKRGQNEESFEGHDTTYRVDDLNITQTKFKAEIKEIIDEETFKQITNVSYVAEVMKDKERRAMLFDLVEELTDQDVINSNKDLAPLAEILGGHSVDDTRQLIKQESTSINNDLKAIPNRIDEVDRTINKDLKESDKELLNAKKELAETQINELEKDLASVKNGNAAADIELKIRTKRTELTEAKSNFVIENSKQTDSLLAEQGVLRTKALQANILVEEKERELTKTANEIKTSKEYIAKLNAVADEGRIDYARISAEHFPDFDEHKKVCSLCGSEYPEEKQAEIKANYEKEQAKFNLDKAEKLEKNNEQGRSTVAEISEIEAHVKELEIELANDVELKNLIENRTELKAQFEDLKSKIAVIEENAPVFEDSEAYQTIQKEIEDLQEKAATIVSSSAEEIQAIETKIYNKRLTINEVNDQLHEFTLNAKQEARKEELVEQEKQLSARYGELDNQLFLIEEFIRTKVNLLTDKINSNFSIVTFKLFEEQINGGLKEICEPLVNGVPFSTGLNNASRINAGLDIINTISKLKAVTAPIFVDNAESVTQLIPTAAQTIQLIVSKSDKKLRVEVAE